jgi:hypothetical protein
MPGEGLPLLYMYGASVYMAPFASYPIVVAYSCVGRE